MLSSESAKFDMALQLMGRANPVFFLTEAIPRTPREDKRIIRDYLDNAPSPSKPFPRPVYAGMERVRSAWRAAEFDPRTHPLPKIILPRHVFPVHIGSLDTGFVIPLEVKSSTSWQMSDAFGTFGFLDKNAQNNPVAGLMALLTLVERVWEETYHHILPARWLQALNLSLLCPMHMDLVTGESLQVPLLVSVLRTLGSAGRLDTEPSLPLGDGPVFASGVIRPDGAFGEVECIPKKLEGFVRELGTGHPALLTREQLADLRCRNPELLNQVDVKEVNNIKQLIEIEDLREGLDRLCASHHPSLNDILFDLSVSLSRKIEFDEVQQLSTWVLSHVDSPYYQFRFSIETALVLCHPGRFAEAWEHLERARALFTDHPKLFGVNERARLFEATCDMAIDACMPDPFAGMIEQLTPDILAGMSGVDRVRVYGSLCQFYRMFGQHRKAIQAGEQAVALVDDVFASSAGRSRNYLSHALIVAYRESSDKNPDILRTAATRLEEAKTYWAPQYNQRAQAAHLGFCLHVEAEIARLSGRQFPSPRSPHPHGNWSHPWLFTLLSCARNDQHDHAGRLAFLERLIDASHNAVKKNGDSSLFGLFDAVYRLFHAVFCETDTASARDDLKRWLETKVEDGFPGWHNYLTSFIKDEMTLQDAERLCDAIRYH